MRKLLWIVVLGALAWGGWWWAASSGLNAAITTWFNDRTTAGWQVDVGQITGGGFPFTIRAGLKDVAIADTGAGLSVQTDRLDIAAPAWWPGDVTVTLSDAPILIASPFGRSELTMTNSIATLNLHPGPALELDTLGWTAQAWTLSDAQGVQAAADSLTLSMTQTQGAMYSLIANADAFTPGDGTKSALRLPDSFPTAFDSLKMHGDVTFDQPWDRRALDDRRPQPRQITLTLAEVRWGDLTLNIAADLAVDAQGVPTGTLTLQAENWRTILDMAENSGALPPQLRRQAEGIVRALAGASGNENTLDVELALRGGALYLGFFPIAATPRLVIR